MTPRSIIALLLFTTAATASHAYADLKLPQRSPAARISQTVGLTEITIAYHRPAVSGRKIWGEVVPYNETWRVGANENTTIEFSSDVKVAGQPLRAGTYGLHMIPTPKDWTVAFSTVTTAWGSGSYDPKEDALRVSVTPRASAVPEERMAFRFDDLGDSKATLVLAWDKLVVPLAIEIDTPKVVMASVRGQLRGEAGFTWDGHADAARYWLQHGGPLGEAMQLAERSIRITPNYHNQMTRAEILEKQGDARAAAELRAKILPQATERELIQAGYQLSSENKLAEAVTLFQTAVARFPASWRVQDGYAEVLAARGDKPAAIAAYTKALALAKEPAHKKRVEGALASLQAKR